MENPLVWQPLGQPIRVVVHPYAAGGMREAALRRSAGGDGFEESGGLLLGSIERGRVLTVTVEEIEPVVWPGADSLRGGELEATLKARAAGETGRAVVGYYRTATHDDLYLHAGDMALIRVCFPDPANVFFLLKPGEDDTLSSRLYFWQGGILRSDTAPGGQPFGRPAADAPGEDLAGAPPPSSPFRELLYALPRHSRKRLWAAAAAAVAAVTLPLAAAHWYLSRPSLPAAPTVRQLELEVDKRPTDLVVRWNGASPTVRMAERAVLHIRDGPFLRSYDIDADQLRTGSVYYAPLGGDIEFRLEVFGRDSQPVVESIRVLSGSLLAATSLPADRPNAAPPAAAPPAPAAKPTRKNIPRSAGTASLPRPRTVHYSYEDAEPAAGNTAGPRPIRQVNPTVPPGMLAGMRGGAEFGVKVYIDRTGKVTGAQLVSRRGAASAMLADSALNAARMWRFKPALRGGRPVASNTVLNIRVPAANP